ncbi:uncharacterized protein K460DRAFT_105150 [Cucurbitaria berberidis CBS 394.84]|uniref:Uncharacterized protein n=1 Tax=Cucurbitaria berberidis CBS 394.84 TaxID=1168544 RepID=A0A9P4GGJ7_9PLEO|nr:uncharacterized protein K460DRAFT_105150 [Cucurbitaria berberidis CBS 394.84]KAF1845222.1 hypothetical protein K460DRAFT_105150 [Cucurbitaria berberidis CBS 394.84]
MLRTISRHSSETAGGSSRTFGKSEEHNKSKPRIISKRKISTSKPKVTFKTQTWSDLASKPSATHKARTTTVTRLTSPGSNDSRLGTKRHSRFGSLFISLLAVSPMAIEFNATNQQTIEAAQKATTQPTQPTPPKKAYIRPGSGVRPSETCKTKWKRLKYEVRLKMKSRSKGNRQEREKWTQIEELELEELKVEERES